MSDENGEDSASSYSCLVCILCVYFIVHGEFYQNPQRIVQLCKENSGRWVNGNIWLMIVAEVNEIDSTAHPTVLEVSCMLSSYYCLDLQDLYIISTVIWRTIQRKSGKWLVFKKIGVWLLPYYFVYPHQVWFTSVWMMITNPGW